MVLTRPLWEWAIVSLFLGLGFTFFSGAFEAWLVDALTASGFRENLESIFANAQIVEGTAMLFGSVVGGILAQTINLGFPYVLRIIVFIITFILALIGNQDRLCAKQKPRDYARNKKSMEKSIRYGLKRPSVRWVMFAALF